MNHSQIIKTFLEFFQKHDHHLLPNASLIPKENDPSGLFTNSGMHPIKSYFLGLEEPPSKRLCSNQKSFRTIDIDDVGNNGRTLTFFFMLGSWSIGDYFKKTAIKLAYDLLINGYKFPKDKLYATVFKGSAEVPEDKESYKAWLDAGIPEKRIVKLSEKDNFWSAGPIGPCGPSTEVYYDRGTDFGCKNKNCKPGCDCDRFLEIWNAGVFMQYDRKEDGSLKPLPFNSVDTGAGVERLAAVLQNKETVFETTLFLPIIEKIEKLSNKNYKENKKPFRIIADHLRASVFLISDGVLPSKMDRGYVLRRLLRRSIRYGKDLNLQGKDYSEITKEIIKLYRKEFNELVANQELIISSILDEYNKFTRTLERGLKRFNIILENLETKTMPGKDAFKLYDTFGFPLELTRELAAEKGYDINEEEYKDSFETHKEVSRQSLTKKFKGGVGDASYEATKLHTATHLLHQALKNIVDKKIDQKGSNITAERLRYDFNFDRKLTSQELKDVEDLVNQKIKEELVVKKEIMTLEQAKKSGAHGIFEHKYGDKISVYTIKGFSKEICGGPHVSNTSELGHFKILKEQSSSAGIRRIKAILE